MKYGKRNINTEIKCKSMSYNSSRNLKLSKDCLSFPFSLFFQQNYQGMCLESLQSVIYWYMMPFYWLSIDTFMDILLEYLFLKSKNLNKKSDSVKGKPSH